MFVKEGRSKKCALHTEQKVGKFVMVLISCGSSFHSLGLVPKKAVSPAQTNFTPL